MPKALAGKLPISPKLLTRLVEACGKTLDSRDALDNYCELKCPRYRECRNLYDMAQGREDGRKR